MIFMTILSFLLGLLGYIGYNDKTNVNLFYNLHDYGILQGKGDILAAFYSISLIISSVLYIYPI